MVVTLGKIYLGLILKQICFFNIFHNSEANPCDRFNEHCPKG